MAWSFSAQAPWSLFPRTAVTGAMRASSASTAGSPTSPACTMWQLPRSAASASGRSRPCVSEISPTQRRPALLALREPERMRDHAGRANQQAQPDQRLDGGELLVPLLVVGPADEGLQHREAVDLGAEHDQRAGGDDEAAGGRAPPQQDAGEQEHQPHDEPRDQPGVGDHAGVFSTTPRLSAGWY